MSAQLPDIGEWYRLREGDAFEVVAIDEDDRTVEVQHFDGTLEEYDLDDWNAQWSSGAIEASEPPEDWSGSVDVEEEDDSTGNDDYNNDRRLNASGLEGLDLFE